MGLFFKDEFDRKAPSDKSLRHSFKTSDEENTRIDNDPKPKKESRFSMDDNYYQPEKIHYTSNDNSDDLKKYSVTKILGIAVKIASVISVISLIYGLVSCFNNPNGTTHLSKKQSDEIKDNVFLDDKIKFLSESLYYSRIEIIKLLTSDYISEDEVNEAIDGLLEKNEISFVNNATHRIFKIENYKDKDDSELSQALSEFGFTDEEIRYAISSYNVADQQIASYLESAKNSDN